MMFDFVSRKKLLEMGGSYVAMTPSYDVFLVKNRTDRVLMSYSRVTADLNTKVCCLLANYCQLKYGMKSPFVHSQDTLVKSILTGEEVILTGKSFFEPRDVFKPVSKKSNNHNMVRLIRIGTMALGNDLRSYEPERISMKEFKHVIKDEFNILRKAILAKDKEILAMCLRYIHGSTVTPHPDKEEHFIFSSTNLRDKYYAGFSAKRVLSNESGTEFKLDTEALLAYWQSDDCCFNRKEV